MAAKPKSNDLWSMKKLKLLSLVGITSIALAHAGWAAGHGGGGGGFGGGFPGGGFGGHFSSMRGGHTFARGGTGTWGGNWRHYRGRFSNDVFFTGDFGFPGWWGWDYPYGYYGYDYYPYDYYGYAGYGYYGGPGYSYYDGRGYGYRYGSRSRHLRRLQSR